MSVNRDNIYGTMPTCGRSRKPRPGTRWLSQVSPADLDVYIDMVEEQQGGWKLDELDYPLAYLNKWMRPHLLTLQSRLPWVPMDWKFKTGWRELPLFSSKQLLPVMQQAVGFPRRYVSFCYHTWDVLWIADGGRDYARIKRGKCDSYYTDPDAVCLHGLERTNGEIETFNEYHHAIRHLNDCNARRNA